MRRKVLILTIGLCIAISFSALEETKAMNREEEIAGHIQKIEEACKKINDLKELNKISDELSGPMKALSEIGEPAVPKLLEAFEDKEKDWKFRYLLLQQIAGIRYRKGMVTKRGGLQTLAQATPEKVEESKKTIELLITSLKEEERPEIRGTAAVTLGIIGNKETVESLVEALKDEDKQVRSCVVGALGRIKDDKAVGPLIDALNNEENFVVRVDLVLALGSIGDVRAVRLLIETLNSDESVDVRAKAAMALGMIGDKRAVEPLIKALEDKHPLVQAYASEALGKLSDRRAIEPLKKSIKRR